MTKQLEAGGRLHSLSGGVPVEQIENPGGRVTGSAGGLQPDRRRFQHLISSTERRAAVHDNTPRKPTAALLPGLVPAQPCSGDHRAK